MNRMEQARLSKSQRKANKAIERQLQQRERQRDPRVKSSFEKALKDAVARKGGTT